MTTCLGKSCSFGLPRVPFVNCCLFMYLVISLLVLRAGCGIWLYRFLIIAYLFTLKNCLVLVQELLHSSQLCCPCLDIWSLHLRKLRASAVVHFTYWCNLTYWWQVIIYLCVVLFIIPCYVCSTGGLLWSVIAKLSRLIMIYFVPYRTWKSKHVSLTYSLEV